MIDAGFGNLSEDDARALFDKMEDPVWFAENILGVRTWSRQRDFLRAIKHHPRVAYKSAHKVSKSHSLAIAALWWCITKYNARVPLTSAAFHQVTNILWREVRAMYANSKIDLGGEIYRDPATGLKWQNGNEIFGFSTDQPERAAGISGANILYMVDEAAGVVDPVFEAMEGNMAAGAKMVLTSQPTRLSGLFFDAFHSQSNFWHTITTSAMESPNVTGEMEIPGLASKKWVEEMREKYGESSPFYQVRVLGRFPGQAADSVIGLGLVEDAVLRYKTANQETLSQGALRVGVDVARFGDDETVIQVVRGHKAYPPITHYNLDGSQVAGHTLDAIRRYKHDRDEEVHVKVDVIGLGASPVDFLNVMDESKGLGVVVRPVHVQEVSDDPDVYHDLRTQLCFDLRTWLEDGGAIPDDEQLKREMTSPTYKFDSKGRRQLLPKAKEKEILGQSPDRRNALELAIYNARPRQSLGGAHINF